MQEKLEIDVIAFFSIFYYCHLYHALVRMQTSLFPSLNMTNFDLIDLSNLRTLKLFVLVANFAVQTSKGSTFLFHLRIVCSLCNMHFTFNTIIRFKMINILVFKLQVGLISVRENIFLKSINIYKKYIFPNLSSNPRVEAWRMKRYIVFRKCIYFDVLL